MTLETLASEMTLVIVLRLASAEVSKTKKLVGSLYFVGVSKRGNRTFKYKRATRI